MNVLSLKIGSKRRKLNMNNHKSIRITDPVCENDKIHYELDNGKAWQLMEKNCTRGVTGYRIVYGTRFLYYKTILNWGIGSISLKCLYQVWYMKEHWNLQICLYKCYEHEYPSSCNITVYLSISHLFHKLLYVI